MIFDGGWDMEAVNVRVPEGVELASVERKRVDGWGREPSYDV